MAHDSSISESDVNSGLPETRDINFDDIKDAIRLGIEDFSAKPTHIFFICLFYPIIGVFLSRLIFGYEVLPLLFPVVAGFTLVGPIAAIGLYELSRRREQGLDISILNVFDVLKIAVDRRHRGAQSGDRRHFCHLAVRRTAGVFSDIR